MENHRRFNGTVSALRAADRGIEPAFSGHHTNMNDLKIGTPLSTVPCDVRSVLGLVC